MVDVDGGSFRDNFEFTKKMKREEWAARRAFYTIFAALNGCAWRDAFKHKRLRDGRAEHSFARDRIFLGINKKTCHLLLSSIGIYIY